MQEEGATQTHRRNQMLYTKAELQQILQYLLPRAGYRELD